MHISPKEGNGHLPIGEVRERAVVVDAPGSTRATLGIAEFCDALLSEAHQTVALRVTAPVPASIASGTYWHCAFR